MPADPPKNDELETFRTEYRRLIGGAMISGLITPRVVGSISDFKLVGGGGLEKDYDQNSGNYTQIGGNDQQNSGNYDQQ